MERECLPEADHVVGSALRLHYLLLPLVAYMESADSLLDLLRDALVACEDQLTVTECSCLLTGVGTEGTEQLLLLVSSGYQIVVSKGVGGWDGMGGG